MLKKIITGLIVIFLGVCALILVKYIKEPKEQLNVNHKYYKSHQNNLSDPVTVRADSRKEALGLKAGINVPKLKTLPTVSGDGNEGNLLQVNDAGARKPVVVISKKEYSKKRKQTAMRNLPSFKLVEQRVFEKVIATANLNDTEKKSLIEAYSKWWNERDEMLTRKEHSVDTAAIVASRKKLDEYIINLLGKSKGVSFIESEIKFSNNETGNAQDQPNNH